MSRLLFVEDEPQLLRAMRITLRSQGFEVHTAADGRHALSEAAAWPPDLVVLDLGLPDMDGVEVIRGLRGWSGVPIIVLSGRVSGQDKVAALDAGADDYVTKPFSIGELLARIRAVTRRAAGAESVPVVELGRYRIDLAERRISLRDGIGDVSPEGAGGGRRRAGRSASHSDGMAIVGSPCLPSRQARQSPTACAAGVGTWNSRGQLLPSTLYQQVAPQARTRSCPAPLPDHRTRHGLPLPAVTVIG